jgi:hypothetical protein
MLQFGRNETLTAAELNAEFATVHEAYRRSGAADRLRLVESAPAGPGEWLAGALKP